MALPVFFGVANSRLKIKALIPHFGTHFTVYWYQPVTSPSENQTLTYAFVGTLALTLFVYFLRGFGVPGFTALPGGIILVLILLSIAAGIVYGVQKTRRY